MNNKKTIAIIGGGFCGMMTAVHLMQQNQPVNIIIINDGYPFGRGVAYSAHTDKYLLNVRAINMSAFEDNRCHFLDWLHLQPAYQHIPKNILANIYAPRKVYGDYLSEVWTNVIQHKHPGIDIQMINQKAVDVCEQPQLLIELDNNETITADAVVLATGNTVPRHVSTQNKAFLNSNKYHANPWTTDSVSNVKQLKNILIVGNGLTMIDTLQGLLENGFKGKLYTISPNGFKLIPHKYNLLVYDKIIEELPTEYSLNELFVLVRKHIKSLTEVGIGSHLVTDAIRPYTQQMWQTFSLDEKRRFLKKFSHAWTILRHRLPMHIYEMVQELRLNNRMQTITGFVTNISESSEGAMVTYFNKQNKSEEQLIADRVINCTGPELNVNRSANKLIKNMSLKGLIKADELFLGIEADVVTGAVINQHNEKSETIFTTGGNLKGMLWESTAVPDIRVQTQRLALHLAEQLKEKAVAV